MPGIQSRAQRPAIARTSNQKLNAYLKEIATAAASKRSLLFIWLATIRHYRYPDQWRADGRSGKMQAMQN